MRGVKVKYTNDYEISTSINGTDEEIEEYFKIGRWFNVGSDKDNMQKVVEIEILD